MVIRKIKHKYHLYSKSINPKTGKRKILGTFKTRAEAIKREKQIQYFKHKRK